jgi:hypothetical protein
MIADGDTLEIPAPAKPGKKATTKAPGQGRGRATLPSTAQQARKASRRAELEAAQEILLLEAGKVSGS